MKRLHLLVLKSFFGPFFLTFFICVFVLLMQFLWKYIDELVGKGLEFGIVVELLFYTALALVYMAFPLAMLLSSIMAFGDLGENYELVAMKASGISLSRIMRPLIIVAIGLCIFAFYFSNTIVPHTNLKFNALFSSVRQQKPEMVLSKGVFSKEIDGYSFKYDENSPNSKMLYKILIHDHTHNTGNVPMTIADSGYMEISEDKKFLIITLFSGQNYEDVADEKRKTTYPFRRTRFSKSERRVSLKGFDFKRPDDNMSNQNKMMTLSQLRKTLDSLYIDYNMNVRRLAMSLNYNEALRSSIGQLSDPNDTLQKYNTFMCESKTDFMEVYDEMPFAGKLNAITSALEQAKNNKLQINQSITFNARFKRSINMHDLERYRKFTWSIACVIFFFIGAPLGAIIRKGGLGMPVVVSILLFISYYIVTIIGEKFARDDVWIMANGMWLSSLVFLPFGLFLTYKAVNDSGLLSTETYQSLLKRLIMWIQRKKD